MLSGLINTNERTLISVEQIKADGGTQMRAGLDDATVTEYADFFRESRQWGDFPPVVLYHDGADYWLADGFHRVAAWKRAGNVMLGATKIPADVRSGTRRDAILHAAGANANHGLRRTNADKRRAVEVMLRDEEWAQWSDAEIARRCNVSPMTVGRIRSELISNNVIDTPSERTVQRGGQTYTQNTANIGANRPAAQSPSRRYESGLPALDMPRPVIGAQPKSPITDWELSDICETVANEMFGDITRSRVVSLTRIMVSDATTKQGGYWDKLLRTLAPFDAAVTRIQAAVADAAQRMVAERGGADTEPEASAPAPAAKPPMTPEAKELSREIKAQTWGDKPYAEVWQIQTAIADWAAKLTPGELRQLARYRGGAAWFDCRVALGEMRYRDRDLVQALNNLAATLEQRVEATGAAAADAAADPWVAAWKVRPYDSMIKQADRLVVEVTGWAQTWTDDKGRTWRDVVGRNPQHANSPFRQDLEAECRRRGLALSGEEMAETIRILFVRLQLDEPMDTEDEPLTDADMLVMQSAASAPALTANGLADMLRPLVAEFYDDGSDAWQRAAARDMRLNASESSGAFWNRCEREVNTTTRQRWTLALLRVALNVLADELPSVPLTPPIEPPITMPLKNPPNEKIGRARRLIAGYQATIATFDEYGELIGAHLETLPAKRELEKLIKHLSREIDLMEGKVVEEAWG